MTVVEPTSDPATTERARLVKRHRAALLGSGRSITIDALAQAQGKSRDAVRQWARRQRQAGRLVYVHEGGAVHVPAFQLDDSLELDVLAGDLVADLVGRGMSDWAVWTWFDSPSPWLEGRTPAEALRDDDVTGVRRAVAGLFQD